MYSHQLLLPNRLNTPILRQSQKPRKPRFPGFFVFPFPLRGLVGTGCCVPRRGATAARVAIAAVLGLNGLTMTTNTEPRSPFDALGDENFVLLTTFRKTGVAVATPVWVARDGDALLVITPDDTGKVKRLRNNSRVQLQPSTRLGKPSDSSEPVEAVAEVLPPAATDGFTAQFRKKYGFQYTLTMFIERVLARRQKPRVILRIVRAS